MERPKADMIVHHIFKKWTKSWEQEIQFYSIAIRDLILVCFYYYYYRQGNSDWARRTIEMFNVVTSRQMLRR
jgi:hypothetical protein